MRAAGPNLDYCEDLKKYVIDIDKKTPEKFHYYLTIRAQEK